MEKQKIIQQINIEYMKNTTDCRTALGSRNNEGNELLYGEWNKGKLLQMFQSHISSISAEWQIQTTEVWAKYRPNLHTSSFG